MKRIKTTKLAVATLCLASLAALTACGGGSSGESAPSTKLSTVRVFGDSLADSGTFGFKATVQSSDNYLFTERIALNYGQTLCPYYKPANAALDAFAPNTAKTGCTNYAIAGGVINSATLTNPTANKKGIQLQLVDGAATAYSPTELVIIDGGGNDAANLVGAFLATQLTPGAAANAQWAGLLGSVSSAAAAAAADPVNSGILYMTGLADKFYDTINATVLSKGATHVVIANIPDITLTPRFQMVLAGIGAAKGAAVQQQLTAVFKGWVEAFNKEIAVKAGTDGRVVVIDIYSNFQDEVANPAQYALSNVKDPSCPITGQGSDGLPTYDFPACTTTAAKPGWQTYLFADGFHPTPYGHQLASQLIARSIAQKGWL